MAQLKASGKTSKLVSLQLFFTVCEASSIYLTFHLLLARNRLPYAFIKIPFRAYFSDEIA
jgi:hypothetical protein